jgi:hypothetical protein
MEAAGIVANNVLRTEKCMKLIKKIIKWLKENLDADLYVYYGIERNDK